MQTLEQLHLSASQVTIGVYDGVHRGHQVLLQRLLDRARQTGQPAVVVTFHPHPTCVLGQDPEFKLLTTPEERADLLYALGIDHVVVLPFTRQLAATSARDFMQRLTRHLNVRGLVIGHDFALGRGREGNAERLRQIGLELGYQVEQVSALRAGEQIYSSSAVRRALTAGDVRLAARLLGRPYALRGTVVHGDGRGRKINVPTANLETPPVKLIPAFGVYAGWAEWRGERFPAVTNIGLRPTFTEDPGLRVEVHILDLQENLYDQQLTFHFVERLRPERKFDGVEALLTQIRADIAQTRQILQQTS